VRIRSARNRQFSSKEPSNRTLPTGHKADPRRHIRALVGLNGVAFTRRAPRSIASRCQRRNKSDRPPSGAVTAMHRPGAASATGLKDRRASGLARQVMFFPASPHRRSQRRSPLWRWGRTAMRSSSTRLLLVSCSHQRALDPETGWTMRPDSSTTAASAPSSSGRSSPGRRGDAVISGATSRWRW
jgi:hypothetical protein